MGSPGSRGYSSENCNPEGQNLHNETIIENITNSEEYCRGRHPSLANRPYRTI